MSQPRGDTPAYYMPYDSDEDVGIHKPLSESESESDTESDRSGSASDYEDHRIRREEDPRYALIRAAGPNFDTYDEQLKFMEDAPGDVYNSQNNITSLEGLRYLNPPKTTITSLLSIKSSNRDRRVWPSPYYFSIKTPRVYKNVTKFQLVQISFPNNNTAVGSPSSFVSSIITTLLEAGVDPCCLSSCVGTTETTTGTNATALIEQGRVNESGNPMLVTLSVPEGAYSNSQLAYEMTTQANNTPPFNLITYDEFKEIFQTTGDITVLFNEPGDIFQSKLLVGRHTNFTKDTIMNCYYTHSHIQSFPVITDRIAFNAYYYPVLKELISTHMAIPFLETKPYTYEYVADIVMNKFDGLDSGLYYDICLANRGVLDNYRKFRTFRYKNINKYIWNWDDKDNRFSCVHNELHTSIHRDIQYQLNRYMDHELHHHGLTKFAYQTMKQQFYSNNAVYKHLTSHLSTLLANYHFVSNYQYQGGFDHITKESTFHVEDLNNDSTFTSMFQCNTVFGNQYNNLPGVAFTFSTFLDYHSTLSSYCCLIRNTNSTLCGVHENSYARHHQYVVKKYTGILPDTMLRNKTYNNNQGVPVAFGANQLLYYPGESVNSSQNSNVVSLGSAPMQSLQGSIVNLDQVQAANVGGDDDPCGKNYCSTACGVAISKLVASWYGCLPVDSAIGSFNYRLGLQQFNLTNFQFTSTLFAALSTNADYFMQINEEQNFNNMDVAMDENYNISNETTGQVKLMSCKILTGGLGSGEISNSVIQNPSLFENYLGKLDKLTFKIYYNDGPITPAWLLVPFKDLTFNEWEATFQIEEAIAFADRDKGFGVVPTIPIPNNPVHTPYLGFTSADNPNNKTY